MSNGDPIQKYFIILSFISILDFQFLNLKGKDFYFDIYESLTKFIDTAKETAKVNDTYLK